MDLPYPTLFTVPPRPAANEQGLVLTYPHVVSSVVLSVFVDGTCVRKAVYHFVEYDG